ncbi:cyclic nucleotide-gated channel rod photoreceptor subunit alpha-like isoform X3 [Macrosteles quadrilineatus]|uniref:cyclic nucleotide-gated channel rod photoreceptor subunit alpha-like isoform X1 n=1 Tax=Macrosteles quadrilineatus TaxID=74068 RepID=UPI0023E258D3|nr:cyclic nucleotide-gated channel rod photoreceptor subunit alpha-like isoform X1 [Macrosteles quadrilineatus]XP_054271496.1 cyclic nucleotide-gated channel rod photoreceptor subunit alpha-like isoform X3 [Macrosteles quadrilineatus]
MSTSARRFVQSLTGRRQSSPGDTAASSTRLVHGHHELDEIAVVSCNATPSQVKYGSGPLSAAANGPRIVPGIITSTGRMIGERLSASGTRLDTGSPVAYVSGGNRSSNESLKPSRALKSVSRQSLLDIVSSRLGVGRSKQHQVQRYFSSSRDSLSAAYINRAAVSSASELDLSRKVRRRDLRGRLKLPASVAQTETSRWTGGPRNSSGNINGTVTSTETRYNTRRPPRVRTNHKWSFVFDPAGRLCYYWSMVVSLAFLYNFWVIIYRFAFQEINRDSILVWFCLDYLADLLYLVDIMFHFRTGYLEDGVLQTDSTKLRHHYMNSTTFYIDCLCLLPLDFLYLSIGFNSILRSFRLVKIYRFWAFMDRTERHTNYPNLFRSTSLIHYLLVIFHWNGCLFHIVCKNNGFGSKNWVFMDSESADVVKQYLQSYYWCTLALTTIGDLPRPRSKGEYLFVILQLLFGLLLFATVLGHVANIVTSVSAARKEFQDGSNLTKLDGVKTYMRMRRVPNHLQVKVIKWFDYLWLTQKCSDEEKAVSCLPDKLKAEIAINVHLDTLKRVEIFQNTEAGFLCELVLRLRPVLFSPGDYICRKGEVGKEMYIVNRGRLQVVADNGRTVLATLKAGSYFGEISILNMGTAGNRRTASVRSVGYSDLFVLSKKDMWDVLKEYPAARVRLEAIAVKRLEKYKRAPLEKAAMGRSQSTPGLVETKGRVPLEEMWVSPLPPLDPVPPLSAATSGPPPSAYTSNSLFSPALSPTTASRSQHTNASPLSILSSEHTSEEQSCHHVPLSQNTKPPSGPSPDVISQEAFIAEIKRLRERLVTLETENAALSMKLSQQQWEVEHRLAEIEMQICGASSADSSAEDNERNRESII